MKTKTNCKAGGLATTNHSETLVRDNGKGLKVRTNCKAGGGNSQHNETLVRDNGKNLKVKTGLRAGKKATS
jgi:hypothetical protein